MAYTGQTLENPASGERITFRQTAANTGGELLAIDLELPANRRVPGGQHIHPKQEERFEVVEGTMRFRMGRERVVAGHEADVAEVVLGGIAGGRAGKGRGGGGGAHGVILRR